MSYALGMAISGFYIHYFGTTSAFIADAIIYSVGFYLLLALDVPSLKNLKSTTVIKLVISGFSYIKRMM